MELHLSCTNPSIYHILYTYLLPFPGICLRQLFISGHLWGESTSYWWFPSQRASNVEMFLYQEIIYFWWIYFTPIYYHSLAFAWDSSIFLAICEGNPPVIGGFPHKGPVIHKVFLSRHHLISLRDSLIFASDSSLFLAICEGNLPVTGGLPSKRDSNVERHHHINGFVQERCNSSALAMELRLSCTNPSIYLWGIYSTLIHYHFPKSSLFLVICEGNPTVSGGFPPQRASDSEMFLSRHHPIFCGEYTIYQFITIPCHLPAAGWW